MTDSRVAGGAPEIEPFVQALGLLMQRRTRLTGEEVREIAAGDGEDARQLFFQRRGFEADHEPGRWDELLADLSSLWRVEERLHAVFASGARIETTWPRPHDPRDFG